MGVLRYGDDGYNKDWITLQEHISCVYNKQEIWRSMSDTSTVRWNWRLHNIIWYIQEFGGTDKLEYMALRECWL